MKKVFHNVTFDELKIGQSATIEKKITQDDIELFAGVSGDVNPAHLDQNYADHSIFHGVIAHGMLSGALISAVLGTKLPGPGTIYLNQSLQFKAPVRVGDTITALVTVASKIAKKKIVKLECKVINQKQKIVVKGFAKVMAPIKKIVTKKPHTPNVIIADQKHLEID
jgi:acyl dehydratase